MLSDERTYEKLEKDPTPKYKSKLVSMLQNLKKEDKITDKQYKELFPTAENIPRIYATPKIHKPQVPLKPIVDYTGSIGYSTSRALADILGPLVGNTIHHVKNSKDLAQEMSEVLIEEDEIFNSHDVVSLFTNVPIQQAIDVVRQRLNDDTSLKNRTLLSVDNIMELLEFILTTTYFMFRGQIYQQRFGTAMGSPVSPIIANIYMEFLEQRAIATAPIECKPRMWKRFVDDVLEIINNGKVDQLTEHLNQVDTTGNIKFTHEQESEGQIPFLDTLIVRKDDGSVKLLVYRKKTHTDQYLNFQSHHPLHHKLGVVRTLLDRMDKVVTEEEDRKVEEDKIRKALKQCGYPEWTVNKVKTDKVNKQAKAKPKPRKEKNKATTRRTLVTVPYIQGLTEKLQRIYHSHQISTAVRPHTSLRKMLVHPKDKIDIDNVTGCVYEIPCHNCEKTYIGETGRLFGTRKKEHQDETERMSEKKFTRAARKDSESKQMKSSIADHVANENHLINWEESNILAKDNERNTR